MIADYYHKNESFKINFNSLLLQIDRLIYRERNEIEEFAARCKSGA